MPRLHCRVYGRLEKPALSLWLVGKPDNSGAYAGSIWHGQFLTCVSHLMMDIEAQLTANYSLQQGDRVGVGKKGR